MLSGLRILAISAALALTGCVSVTEDAYKGIAEIAAVQQRPQGSVLVRIFKEESELEVWKLGADGRYALAKSFPLCRWSGKLGPKTKIGDRQAPEGFYRVTRANLNPNSKYYRSFNLGYPNPLEASLGYTGDALMVHGACSSAGCFAMTDEGVGEVYAMVEAALASGQTDFQVQAFPFRMTPTEMAKHRFDPNMAFWKNLKLGYDVFEATRREPKVDACGGRYVFDAEPAVPGTVINPAAACPPMKSRIDQRVAAQRARDSVQLQALLESGKAGSASAYADGGMHPRFRDMLAQLGADGLAKQTSGTSVQISRPDAALADPYVAPAPAKPATP